MSGKIVAAIYFHPETYPPTLNAVMNLAEVYEEVIIVARNTFPGTFPLPANCRIVFSGEYIPVRETEQRSVLWKIRSFWQFTRLLKKTIRQVNPRVIVLYDSIPLFSAFLLRLNRRKHSLTWYHNHDVFDKKHLRKYSIGWLAAHYEARAMKRLALFTLPAAERKKYFTIAPGCAYFLLPNFPSKKLYHRYPAQRPLEKVFHLVFQGSVGTGHGLEEIIALLPEYKGEVQLHIKGFFADGYQETITALARQHDVAGWVHVYGPTPYLEVPALASTCHAGIAIHRGSEIMHRSLGTSSNKIYEYAALGLPVLLYDNPHFREHLQQYSWAYFTDCSAASLKQSLADMRQHYAERSQAARTDFDGSLNFENGFKPVLQWLQPHSV